LKNLIPILRQTLVWNIIVIMFLFEKYRPKTVSDFVYNREILEQLIYIAKNDDIPHIILSGPNGGGKKTLVKFFLEALYDTDVNNLTKIKYNVSGSSTKKEIEIMQSNYHIIIEPTNTNHDKYILQEIIKQYAMHKSLGIFKTNRNFKTIVIYNIENLSGNSQAALRRTMEIYAKNCRFVMLCNNLSKVFDPLRSRCQIFCVPLPTPEQIGNVISNIAIMEGMSLNLTTKDQIISKCNDNLKTAIWMLDFKRLKSSSTIALDEVFDEVIDLLLNINRSKNLVQVFDERIRTNIYKILINNIKGSEIIRILLERLIHKIPDNEILAKIIQYASEAEYNLIHGRRDIIHVDYFIAGVMSELVKSHTE